jgi:hypothetical protein
VSGVDLASFAIETGGSFPGVRRPRRDVNHSYPSVPLFPLCAFRGVKVTFVTFTSQVEVLLMLFYQYIFDQPLAERASRWASGRVQTWQVFTFAALNASSISFRFSSCQIPENFHWTVMRYRIVTDAQAVSLV